MPLPDRVFFEGYVGTYAYRQIGFRPPRRGEFYLSGAVVQAWRTPNDLSTPFTVVVPRGPLCITYQEWERMHTAKSFVEYGDG